MAKKPKEETARLFLQIPVSMYKKLEELAHNESRSITGQAQHIIKHYFMREDAKIGANHE